jgi:hypothetical protein
MFRLATCVLEGRRVLLVENDDETADAISNSISHAGGTMVGRVSTVEEAVAEAMRIEIDLVLVHIRYVPDVDLPIGDSFPSKDTEVGFLACFDDWFDFDGEFDGTTETVGYG